MWHICGAQAKPTQRQKKKKKVSLFNSAVTHIEMEFFFLSTSRQMGIYVLLHDEK